MRKTSKSILFYKSKDVVINVPEEDFELMPECCIYEVPKSIRQAKEEAYTPKLISIGPFHYGNKKLAEMEKQKLRYLKKFCERTSMDTLGRLLSFIKEQERSIRKCYSKSFSEAKFQSSKFIKMILCDAIFIIELFLRKLEDENDFLVNKPWLYRDLQGDLGLLENQLPFFVLEGLYQQLAPLPYDNYCFLDLACNYFGIEVPRRGIKHFTDLKRWELVKDYPSIRSNQELGPNDSSPSLKRWLCAAGLWIKSQFLHSPCLLKKKKSINQINTYMDDLCSATMLHEAGVKFERLGGADLLYINFHENKLNIPRLVVSPYSESDFRNVIALEHCHYPMKDYLSAYFELMDHLINTEKDVELLVKEGVVINRVGSATAVAGIINNLLEGVCTSSDCYDDIAKDLIEYHRSSCNRLCATLKQVYFNNLLRGTLSLIAFLVVLLTITQTVVAVLERVNPTK